MIYYAFVYDYAAVYSLLSIAFPFVVMLLLFVS